MCKCKTNLNETNELKWKLCKCDIDTSSLDGFLTRLGLPMYIDLLRTNGKNTRNENFVKLLDTSEKQLEFTNGITNKTHQKIIINALQNARK